jgi:hypothetical protein
MRRNIFIYLKYIIFSRIAALAHNLNREDQPAAVDARWPKSTTDFPQQRG